MGGNVIEGFNKLSKVEDKRGEVCSYLFQVVETKVPLAIEILSNEDDEASASVLDFFRDYLHVSRLFVLHL